MGISRKVVLAAFVGLGVLAAPLSVSGNPSPSAPLGAAVFVAEPRVSYVGSSNTLVQSLLARARTCRLENDRSGVLDAYQQALRADGKNSDLYADCADALASVGRCNEAIAYYQTAIGENLSQTWSSSRMEDGDLQLRFALLLSHVNEQELAADLYRRGYEVLSVKEKKALPSSFRAKELKAGKENIRAEFAAAARTLLALKYAADGFAPEATAQLEAAAAIVPECPRTSYFLANARYGAGKTTEAVALWQKAAQTGDGDLRKWAQEALAKAK
ncbi:MAG: hypothetical protein H7Z41_13065 [Cytophagales bacterium]|nr:hypothetical protein [Armatimonadota bacterium]